MYSLESFTDSSSQSALKESSMRNTRPHLVARRRLLLGVPAVVAAATLAPRAASAAGHQPHVIECVADLLQAR